MNDTFIPSYNYSKKKWYWVEVDQKSLGRLSTEIASILIGKHKIDYHPSVDMGDYVIVTNAEKIRLTGSKNKSKVYFSHSGRPGGSKRETIESLRERIPERIIEKAVKGMLPKGALGRTMYTRLKVYRGSEHPHKAQNPKLVIL
jgi:large subunit ribosomal protein L13|uniref:ribosomal protein L13 n=1 Tax=Paralia sulcata TaxID=216927 RepID=UPI0022F31254|nr:ribosomal protein L13 [Paralia sulcata]WAJ57843.1 ribosomal protein L13 [Paralia sulcata]